MSSIRKLGALAFDGTVRRQYAGDAAVFRGNGLSITLRSHGVDRLCDLPDPYRQRIAPDLYLRPKRPGHDHADAVADKVDATEA